MNIFEDKSTVFYKKYDDSELVCMANEGNYFAEQYIINKYKKHVKMKARTYFLIGADREDIIQEGMIGLYKAVRNYDGLKQSSFNTFAEICINRQIITAIKTATRQKHMPLNYYVSLNQTLNHDSSERTLLDVVDDININDPMALFITKERFKEIEDNLKKVLSKLEMQVLELYLDGKTYREIALEIKRNTKSIDNAIQRIKSKIEFVHKFN